MARTFKCRWYTMLIVAAIGFCLGNLVVFLSNDTTDKQPTIINITVLNIQQPPLETQTKVKPKTKNKPTSKRKTVSTDRKDIISYVDKICRRYNNVSPQLIKSIIYHESRYKPEARNGNCVGLMQVNKRIHKARAKKLGVSNIYDPYSNILVGVDYISELSKKHKDPALVLMLYNMGHDKALSLYKKGQISTYAKMVLASEVK